MKKIQILIAAGAVLCAGIVPALADTRTTKSFSNWQVECVVLDKDNQKTCLMSQGLVNKKTKQRVMSMLVRKPKDGAFKIDLQVPLGGDLAAGVNVVIDNSDPVKVAYRTCMQRGCLAEFELTPAWAKAFGGGTNCTVTVTGLKKETVPFKIVLTGFSDAYAFLTSESK